MIRAITSSSTPLAVLLAMSAGAAVPAFAPQGGAEAAMEAALEARLTNTPFTIKFAKKARDGLVDDTALRSDIVFADGVEMRIKIRRANPGATEFNNEPRYERAAFVMQRLLVDPVESIAPVTVLRPLPLDDLRAWAPSAAATFRGSTDVLAVVQHWLPEVVGPDDAWDAARFESDPGYARQIANVNILTFLIRHKDSNKGNILLSAAPTLPRAWVIDSGVAFGSARSDRGTLWKDIRVPRVPADTIARLRALDLAKLSAALAVLAQYEVRDRRLVAVPPTAPFHKHEGVRRSRNVIQLGLTVTELADLEGRRKALLAKVDSGALPTFAPPPPAAAPTTVPQP
jgi:hypothetical protein